MVLRAGFYRQDVGYYSKAFYQDSVVPKKFKENVLRIIGEIEAEI